VDGVGRRSNFHHANQAQIFADVTVAYIQPLTYPVFGPSRFHNFFVLFVCGIIDSLVTRQRPVRPRIWRSIPRRSRFFFYSPEGLHCFWVYMAPLFNAYQELMPRNKVARLWSWLPFPYTVDVRNVWSFISTPPGCHHDVYRNKLTFIISRYTFMEFVENLINSTTVLTEIDENCISICIFAHSVSTCTVATQASRARARRH
jgi:hypothetical protein